jgi:hypothetical protein
LFVLYLSSEGTQNENFRLENIGIFFSKCTYRSLLKKLLSSKQVFLKYNILNKKRRQILISLGKIYLAICNISNPEIKPDSHILQAMAIWKRL